MRKVTVGFKCDPELKSEIMKDASRLGVSVSEYLESLTETRNSEGDYDAVCHQLQETRHQRNELLKKVKYYEEDLLGPWFKKIQGQEKPFKNPDGTIGKIKINQPEDVLKAILNSIES